MYLQCVADRAHFYMRAADGGGFGCFKPESAGGVPQAAGADRRVECTDRGFPAWRAGGEGICRRGDGGGKVCGGQCGLSAHQKADLSLYGAVPVIHAAL